MTKLSFTHGYALLIGVGNDLPVTVKDATVLCDLLIDSARAGYPAAQVALLTEQKADRESIQTAFDKLIQQVNNDPDATVVVYFSGHGVCFALLPTLPNIFWCLMATIQSIARIQRSLIMNLPSTLKR